MLLYKDKPIVYNGKKDNLVEIKLFLKQYKNDKTEL